MSQPLVSVIIPLYNRKHLISRCVKSVCDQTYPYLEIIVVDDGSTDEPDEVLAELACDERVKVLRKSNGGVSSARNMGLDSASGEYVQFVDSDDLLLASAIERCVEVCEKEQAEGVAYGFAKQTVDTNESRDYTILRKEQCVATVMAKGLLCAPVNKLFRRSKLQELRFIENISMGEDFIFNLSYFSECEKTILLQAHLYYVYIEGSQSLSRRYDPNGFNDVKAQISAINAYLSTPREQIIVDILKRYLWGCYVGWMRKVCDRSGLPFRKKIDTLRLCANDEDVAPLAPYAVKYPIECVFLSKKWLFLFPFVYTLRLKISALKRFIFR